MRGNHVLNQCPMHGCLFDDHGIGGNRVVERLAKPTRVHGDVAAVLDRFALKNRHLIVMFFCDLLRSLLVFRFAGNESFRCLEPSSSRVKVTAGGATSAKSTL